MSGNSSIPVNPDGLTRRRRRPAVSCNLCRRRKIRCNRELPCNNCLRARRPDCVYDHHPPLRSSQLHDDGDAEPVAALASAAPPLSGASDGSSVLSTASTVALSNRTATSTNASTISDGTVDGVQSMRHQIRQLEEQLSRLTASSSTYSKVETTHTALAGTFSFHRLIETPKDESGDGSPVINRGVMHKTRMFGQSHWINAMAMIKDIIEMIEPCLRESPRAMTGMHKCKSLARVIKANRKPKDLEPSPLPLKSLADELLDCYLRTSETVHRVLHVPTFKRDYEAFWVSDTEPDPAFLIQIKLVLAIGAATHDDRFSLRSLAMKWVYEAQRYAAEPIFKPRFKIQHLQTSILLLLAREVTGIGEEFIWTSIGSLIRIAIYMGLHRDPSRLKLPDSTFFSVEMRRRLWNTIVELNLISSHTAGGPPLLTLDDFDTLPPANFDDEQLLADNPLAKPDDVYTDASVAIAIREMLPIRLAITKFLNDIRSNINYDAILRLDRELRSAFKAIRGKLYQSMLKAGITVPGYRLDRLDFIMHRYLVSLHTFFEQTMHNPVYAYTRKVIVDSSLQIWRLATVDTPNRTEDMRRLATCGSGFFRTAVSQAAAIITFELRAQIEDETYLSPAQLRPDLLAVLADAKVHSVESLEAGETNIKGYVVMCMFGAYIDALKQGVTREELMRLVMEAVEEAIEDAFKILERQASQSEGYAADSLDALSLHTTPGQLPTEWDFMVSLFHV
ncbi:hypothetical protein S40285_02432 [Stachybotrys chlorohalonatus IBT 40285]|uniref:Zn(2)-C6 fungal-type domain-containing protein n=1 Tax=Stachybotrys chlorohalonatus (strain IBT 40285) TaxID=1283841 RepID=A0A084R0T5_STAC4|nr:hypothetical protein S40285_02432 [Stachybotrys chlorohalonata IBT 40285]